MHPDMKLLTQYYWRVVEGRPRSFIKIKKMKKYLLFILKYI